MRTLQRAVIGAVAAVVCAAAEGGTVLFVDDDALPGGDGGGWNTALRYLQDALLVAAAIEVSEIRVARGTYRPDRSSASPGGTGDREAVFGLLSGVAMRGGYAGLGAPDPDDRLPAVYETVLGGDLAGDDEPDFVNRTDNSFHVLDGSNTDASAVLDGFVVTGGYADAGNPAGPIRHLSGGGLYVEQGSPTVTGCFFRGNAALGKYNDTGGGAVFTKGAEITLTGCVFDGNWSDGHGGAVHIRQCAVAVLDGCTFTDNVAAIGGGVRINAVELMTITDCLFLGNTGSAAAGAVFAFADTDLRVLNSLFIANTGTLAVGALGTNASQFDVVNCVFAENETSNIGGGIESSSLSAAYTNCVFSRNTATFGGGAYTSQVTVVTNCSFSDNTVNALANDNTVTVRNSILWGSPEAVGASPGGFGGGAVITGSDVQGGWAGAGNIDADPLFVQPGTDDLRLLIGSPCVDAGINSALPPDTLDLDGDGNTTEPVPIDLGGNPRVQGGTVDMGAFEGEFDALPPGESASDIDEGEFAVLVPEGGPFNPVAGAAAIVTNTSGPDNATALATLFDGLLVPPAGGYSELSSVLVFETSLADGEHLTNIFIPFDAADLAGADPAHVNLIRYDQSAGAWALAVAANTVASPGFGGPIGGRIVSVSGGSWGLTQDPGDYGVFWDPASGQGFAWAVVDHAASFGLGVALCPADCLQTPDGVVGIRDLLALLARWGGEAGGGPCDVDFDGVIGQADFLAMLDIWGTCSLGANPLARTPDIDGNGAVEASDLVILQSAWGPCAGDCPGDLDGDGRVGVADHLLMFARWGAAARQERFPPQE